MTISFEQFVADNIAEVDNDDSDGRLWFTGEYKEFVDIISDFVRSDRSQDTLRGMARDVIDESLAIQEFYTIDELRHDFNECTLDDIDEAAAESDDFGTPMSNRVAKKLAIDTLANDVNNVVNRLDHMYNLLAITVETEAGTCDITSATTDMAVTRSLSQTDIMHLMNTLNSGGEVRVFNFDWATVSGKPTLRRQFEVDGYAIALVQDGE